MGHREAIGIVEERDALLVLPAKTYAAGSFAKQNQSSRKESHAAGTHQTDSEETDQSVNVVSKVSFTPLSPPDIESVGTTTATVRWDPAVLAEVSPPLDGGEPINYSLSYSLEYREVVPGKSNGTTNGNKADSPYSKSWLSAHHGPETVYEVATLRPGRHYVFRVRCNPKILTENAELVSLLPSALTEVKTVPTKPDLQQPPSLSSRARTSLKLKWNPPEETGGLPITGYTLFMKPIPPGRDGPCDEEGFWMVPECSDRTCKIAGLRPGMRFTFRVQSTNELGDSPVSLCSVFTTQPSVPSVMAPPEVVSSTPTSVSFRWQAPEDNGAAITGYFLEMDDGSAEGGGFRLAYAGSPQFLQCTVPNLQSGLEYRFRIRADNNEGHGLWSANFSSSTAATPPSSPSPPAVIGANQTSVTLTWKAPPADGGSPVLTYELELLPKSPAAQQQLGREWLVMFKGEGNAHTVGSLQPGCCYMCRVSAINAIGSSPPSAAVEVQSAPGVPNRPSEPRLVAAQSHSLSLQWPPPGHDGGTPITSYRLEMALVSAASHQLPYHLVYGGPETSAEVEGLAPGTSYLFRVSAVNSHGGSAWSASAQHTTRAAVPLQPMPPTPTVTSSSCISLQWEAPEGQGAPVTSYQVEAAPATSGDSSGPPSAPSVSSNGEVHANGGGSGSPLQYFAVYKGGALQADAKGLEPHTEYAFRMRASNAVGPSAWSADSRATTHAAPPAAPLSVKAEGTSSSTIEVAWQAPAVDNGSPVSSYIVEVAPAPSRTKGASSASWQRAWYGTACHCMVDGLRPGRAYLVRVKALNQRGAGPTCDAVHAATLASPPGAPDRVAIAQRGASFVRVKWALPEQDNGSPVQYCTLEYAGVDGQYTKVYTGADTSFKVLGLQPVTQYSFRLAAFNDAGRGPYSEEERAVTLPLPPPPPQDVDVAARLEGLEGVLGCAELKVMWDPPVDTPQCAEVLMYELEAVASAGESNQVWTRVAGGKEGAASISGLPTGTAVSVRMRAVGVDGAGHSAWTPAVRLVTPGPVVALSTARSDGGEVVASAGGAKGRKKAKTKPARARSSDTDDSASISSATHAASARPSGALRGATAPATAKVPPKRKGLKGLLASKTFKSVRNFLVYVLLAAALMFLGKLIYEDAGTNTRSHYSHLH